MMMAEKMQHSMRDEPPETDEGALALARRLAPDPARRKHEFAHGTAI